jgi:hypothetical protein
MTVTTSYLHHGHRNLGKTSDISIMYAFWRNKINEEGRDGEIPGCIMMILE